MSQARLSELHQAAKLLSEHDAVLAPVISRAGICTIEPHGDFYQALAESIIGQQLSVKAAAAIRKRFRGLFHENFPEPAAILEKSMEELRAVGLSGAKAKYIRDLAEHVIDGRLTFDHIKSQSNEQLVTELTAVKGIGEWTAQMFLIFCVGRLDVLPTGDLGIRNGIRTLYHLTDIPTPAAITELAQRNHWHPYESVASWYIWRSLENEPVTTA